MKDNLESIFINVSNREKESIYLNVNALSKLDTNLYSDKVPSMRRQPKQWTFLDTPIFWTNNSSYS